jgi:hypothetical protein
VDFHQLAAEIAARNKAARDKSSDIAGRMAKALSQERYKYFEGLLDDERDGSTEGDVEAASGSSGETGAVDSSGGMQLDERRNEEAGGERRSGESVVEENGNG